MVDDIGKTYFSTLFGCLIQFGLMLFVYSLFVPTEINIIVFLSVVLGFGLVLAPIQLMLNSRKKGED
jgi:uncharacterized membrane protein YccC